ncbi:MAG: methionyl-tRNA formyltransferase [Chloroflexota bacterium]
MNRSLKILFMGTPEFGATILRALVASPHKVIGVVTQPDRPAGRKNVLTPPPVKQAALELGLPVLQVERLRGAKVVAELKHFSQEADLFVVAAFGMLLSQTILDLPPLKCINVHGSLLPEYRGASPVAQALLDGREETGVTIMRMEKGLDTGPMLSKVVIPITPDETQTSLMQKLAESGASLLLETLPRWAAGEIRPEPQDETKATLTGIIEKEAGRIDWREPATLIERKTRAYDPWPGLFTYWKGQPLKILKAEVFPEKRVTITEPHEPTEPGRVYLARISDGGNQERLVIATGADFLAPLELQLAGKKAVKIKDFLQGQRAIIGSQLASQT